MRKTLLQPEEPAWPVGQQLRVAAPAGLTQAPHYVWHEKEQDFIMAGFVPAGTVVVYEQAWRLRGTRYAECSIDDAVLIFIQDNVQEVGEIPS